jgi:outer membrane usher protein FimD/PapC
MTFCRRSFLHLLLPVALSACAAAPRAEREIVKVRTDTLSFEQSSFSTRVQGDGANVEHSFSASLDPKAEPLTRLQSSYTQQIGPGGDQRIRVGDTVSTAGMWGSTVRYGGMQFGTRTGARSDVIDNPQLASSGLAVLPTIEDAMFTSLVGRSTELNDHDVAALSTTPLASTLLVNDGCSDFSVGVGKVRRDYAMLSNEYGPLFANTTVACAAPLGFTVEGHGEYLDDDVTALGLGLARQVGPIGTASVAFASSRTIAGSSGWLARFGFEHSSSLFNIALRSQLQSREFRDIGSTVLTDPIMQRDLASVGVNVTDSANLALAYATQTTWERVRIDVVALKQSVRVGRGALSMSAGHSFEENFGSSLFISYQRPLGLQTPARSPIQEFNLATIDSLFMPR